MNRYVRKALVALKREWPTIVAAGIVGGIIGYYVEQSKHPKESEVDHAPIFDGKSVEEDRPRSQYRQRDISSREESRFTVTVDLGKPSLEQIVSDSHIRPFSYDQIKGIAPEEEDKMPADEISSLGYDESDEATGPLVYADPAVVTMDEGAYSVIGRRELNDLAAQRDLVELQYFPDAEIIVGGEKWNTMVNDSMQEVIEAFIVDNPAADEVYLREDGTDADGLYRVLIRTGASYSEEVELHLDLLEIPNE